MANILTTGKLTPNVYTYKPTEVPLTTEPTIPSLPTIIYTQPIIKIIQATDNPNTWLWSKDPTFASNIARTGDLGTAVQQIKDYQATGEIPKDALIKVYDNQGNLIGQFGTENMPRYATPVSPTGEVGPIPQPVLPVFGPSGTYGAELRLGANAPLILQEQASLSSSNLVESNTFSTKFILENQPVIPTSSFMTSEGIYGKMYTSESSPAVTYYAVEGYKGLTHALEEPMFFRGKPTMRDITGVPEKPLTLLEKSTYTTNPFTGETFKLVPYNPIFSFPNISFTETPSSYGKTTSTTPIFTSYYGNLITSGLSNAEYNLQLNIAKSQYEKATPIEKVGYNLAVLFSPRGNEYVGSYFTKETTPKNVAIENMAKTRLGGQNISNYLNYEAGFLTGSPIGTAALGAIGGVILGAGTTLAGMTNTGTTITRIIGNEIFIGGMLGLAATKPIFEYASGVPRYKIIGGIISEVTGFAGGILGASVGKDLVKIETKPFTAKIGSQSKSFTNPDNMMTTGTGTAKAYVTQESEVTLGGLKIADITVKERIGGQFGFVNPIEELTRGQAGLESYRVVQTKWLGGYTTTEFGGHGISFVPDFKAFGRPSSGQIEAFDIGRSATLIGEDIFLNMESSRVLLTQIGEQEILSYKTGEQEMQQVQRTYTFSGESYKATPEEFANFNRDVNIPMEQRNYMKNVNAIQYDEYLASKGKIPKFEIVQNIGEPNIEGRFQLLQYPSGEYEIKGIEVAKSYTTPEGFTYPISEAKQLEVAHHETIHYETWENPIGRALMKFENKLNIPYDYRLSEAIAYTFQSPSKTYIIPTTAIVPRTPIGYITGVSNTISTEPIMSMTTGGRLLIGGSSSSFSSMTTGGILGGTNSIFASGENMLQQFKETVKITTTSPWSNFYPKVQKTNVETGNDYIVYPKGITNIITTTQTGLNQRIQNVTKQTQNVSNLLNQRMMTGQQQNLQQNQMQQQLQNQLQNQLQSQQQLQQQLQKQQIISEVIVPTEVTKTPPKIITSGLPIYSPPDMEKGRPRPIRIPSGEIYRKRINPILELGEVEKIQKKILRGF